MFKKIIIIVLLIILVICTIYCDIFTNFDKLKDLILSFGVLGFVIFVILFAIASLVSIHGSILAIVGGIIYGPIIGGILSVIGATIGASLSFLVARYLLRDILETKFANNAIYKKINEGIEKNGTDYLIVTRLVIIFPFNIQNYIYGLTSIDFIKYTLITFITIIPGTFLYTFLADELVNNGYTLSQATIIKVIIAGILLSLLAILPKKYFEKKGKI